MGNVLFVIIGFFVFFLQPAMAASSNSKVSCEDELAIRHATDDFGGLSEEEFKWLADAVDNEISSRWIQAIAQNLAKDVESGLPGRHSLKLALEFKAAILGAPLPAIENLLKTDAPDDAILSDESLPPITKRYLELGVMAAALKREPRLKSAALRLLQKVDV